MHCNPAPPHPPAGEVFNAVCPPLGSWPASVLGFVTLFVVIGGIIWLFGRHTGEVTPNG